MRHISARIVDLLKADYQLEVDATSASFRSVRLRDLDLDSLSLLSFLADLEREFRLRLPELEQIARRDCTLGSLSELCRRATARSLALSPAQ